MGKKKKSAMGEASESMHDSDGLPEREDPTVDLSPEPEAPPPPPAPKAPEPKETPKAPAPAAPPLKAAEVEYFRVTRTAVYVLDGMVTTLHAGSIISAATHNLEEARLQGVPYEPCEAPPQVRSTIK